MRVRNDNEAFNEALFNMAALDALLVPRGVKPCSVGIGPACIVDVNTGGFLPLNELAWFRRPKTVERRGGVPVSLSRQAGIPPENLPESFDAASCAGRFAGYDLIFLTDGSNASGGYFLPAAFKGEPSCHHGWPGRRAHGDGTSPRRLHRSRFGLGESCEDHPRWFRTAPSRSNTPMPNFIATSIRIWRCPEHTAKTEDAPYRGSG